MPGTALPYLTALGIGLLVGLERERRKGDGPGRGSAGIRTFALVALLGALADQLGGTMLVAVLLAAVTLLAGLGYRRQPNADPGLTSEVALLLVAMLGALAVRDAALAALLGVLVAGLLAAKPAMHRFARGILTDAEVSDGLVLAGATLVVWPQLPDRAMGPFAAINPHSLWLVVILILAIGAAGHVAVRALGPRYGLAASGLASGFVSSIATIGAMGRIAAGAVAQRPAAVAGSSLSTLSTYVQMAAVLAAISPALLTALAPALAAGGAMALLYGAGWTRRAAQGGAAAAGDSRALGLGAALALAAGMAVMVVLATALQPWLGAAGIAAAAALAGLVDCHSAATAVATLVAKGQIGVGAAAIPVLMAITSNAAMKMIAAFGAGGAAFGARVSLGIFLSLAALWTTAVMLPG